MFKRSPISSLICDVQNMRQSPAISTASTESTAPLLYPRLLRPTQQGNACGSDVLPGVFGSIWSQSIRLGPMCGKRDQLLE